MIRALFASALGSEQSHPSSQRRFLLCNAYPSSTVASIKHNGNSNGTKLAFNECSYIEGDVKERDKIDMTIGEGINGSFEIGELPPIDALLVLIAEKFDEKTEVLSFQKFAFPRNPDTAQVAAIDTYKTNTEQNPMLRMETVEQDGTRLSEKLHFNNVYNVQQGDYELFIDDSDKPTPVQLNKGEEYVVLRTGDAVNFPLDLFAFPKIAICAEYDEVCRPCKNDASCKRWRYDQSEVCVDGKCECAHGFYPK